MGILWISEEDVARLVTMREVMVAVEEAFKGHGQRTVQMPPKVYLDFARYRGDLRAMPAYIEAMEMAGVKVVNSHPDNPLSGLPAVAAVLVLNDPKTGCALRLFPPLCSRRFGPARPAASRPAFWPGAIRASWGWWVAANRPCTSWKRCRSLCPWSA